VWQALYDELRDLRFVVIAIALDKSADDARPWIEKAAPTYPVLIDTQHVVADLYNIVNVPTALWIDERGRIVRPNDVVFGTDTFKHITNLESARPLAAVRAWARGETSGFAASEMRGLQTLPTALDQQARAEFGLAEWLARHGARDAAARHFVRAGDRPDGAAISRDAAGLGRRRPPLLSPAARHAWLERSSSSARPTRVAA